jgi:hypothetical protein
MRRYVKLPRSKIFRRSQRHSGTLKRPKKLVRSGCAPLNDRADSLIATLRISTGEFFKHVKSAPWRNGKLKPSTGTGLAVKLVNQEKFY